MVDQPRTEAGRSLLDDLAYTRDNYLDPILDIEREAAVLAAERASGGVRHHQCGISSNKPFDYIPAALDVERALERLSEGDEGEGCRWCSFSEGHDTGCPIRELVAALTEGEPR